MPYDTTPVADSVCAVNADAINKLADFIETNDFAFNMGEGSPSPSCGSAGCIGGHAAVLWAGVREGSLLGMITWDWKSLRKKLGITGDQHYELCFSVPGFSYEEITREHAVACLRRLAATGKVDWRGSLPPRRR